MKLRLSRKAVQDLDEIWIYSARDKGIDAAESIVGLLTNTCRTLSRNPGIGRRRPDLAEGLHSFATGSYRVYYRVSKGILRIEHIYHAARDERKLWG